MTAVSVWSRARAYCKILYPTRRFPPSMKFKIVSKIEICLKCVLPPHSLISQSVSPFDVRFSEAAPTTTRHPALLVPSGNINDLLCRA